MPGPSRRSFIGWISAIGASIGFAPRRSSALAAATPEWAPLQDARSQALIAALAQAVLPTELGRDGAARVARDFSRWTAAHRVDAEVLHPYGSADLARTGPLPVAAWHRELAGLDAEARRRFSRGFATLGPDQRAEIVRDSLAHVRLAGMPSALSTQHIAVALLSRFYGSAEATDLCYRARIGREQCRPLINATRQPLPLATRPGAEP
jgi:hypothetical protein